MVLAMMLPVRLPPALFYLSGLAKRPEPGAQATAPAMLVITLIMMRVWPLSLLCYRGIRIDGDGLIPEPIPAIGWGAAFRDLMK